MNLCFQIIICLIGVLLIYLVIRSGFKTALVNVHSDEIITRTIAWALYLYFAYLMRNVKSDRKRQAMLSWFAPYFLFITILFYFGMTILGFGLIYWVTDSEPDFVTSLVSSGSALSTLGFYTPKVLHGEFLGIIEGGVGLGVVVFLITFVPGYQTSVQDRESASAKFYAFCGQSPSSYTFYKWIKCTHQEDRICPIWSEWESFLRMIGDTHSESIMVLFTPSLRLGQNWVVTMLAILDSCNLSITTIKDVGKPAAQICFDEGLVSLNMIADAQHIHRQSLFKSALSQNDFFTLCDDLEKLGYEIIENRNDAWNEFSKNRHAYESIVRDLADALFLIEHGDATHYKLPNCSGDFFANLNQRDNK